MKCPWHFATKCRGFSLNSPAKNWFPSTFYSSSFHPFTLSLLPPSGLSPFQPGVVIFLWGSFQVEIDGNFRRVPVYFLFLHWRPTSPQLFLCDFSFCLPFCLTNVVCADPPQLSAAIKYGRNCHSLNQLLAFKKLGCFIICHERTFLKCFPSCHSLKIHFKMFGWIRNVLMFKWMVLYIVLNAIKNK